LNPLILSSNCRAIILGQVLVYSDNDLATAARLAQQIQLMPLNQK
jgi:hypothetical protein